ncbi:MAG TPA: sulfotransferase [Allosphingosinicella sp.]|nr:sulfotransferase [Allosphingosinicella sp.]
MISSNGTNGNGGGSATTVRDPDTDRARLRAVHGALTSGDIIAAGKLAEDALADGIDHPMVLNLVAGRREEQGRLDEALVLLQRALAAAPEAIGVMNAIGLVLSRQSRFEAAAASFGDALAREPRFAPALANRGMALLALGREAEALADFEGAAAVDPDNLIALDGLAALALRRGAAAEARELAARVLAREPGWPGAVLTLAGADLAEGKPEAAEAALAALLGDARLAPVDRALAIGLRGDALDALGRHAEAFAAWGGANKLEEARYRGDYAARPGTLALVRSLTVALGGQRVAAAWGHGGRSPAKRHVFLIGFPGSGAAELEAALAAQPDVLMLPGAEALVDATREWLADADRIARFCALDDEALEPLREAYWRRVAERGVDPVGKVFVDSNAFNIFKLPLIARLFPDARVILARRDPRDAVLAAFRARLPMSDPAWQLLSLEGTAALYAATMALVEASEAAFGLFLHVAGREQVLADPGGEMKALADFIGLPRGGALSAPASWTGEVGRWQDHEDALAPVLPLLAP